MQWEGAQRGLLASAAGPAGPARDRRRPVRLQTVNVAAQRHDPGSLLAWFERMVRTLRECPEVGSGECSVVDAHLPPAVLAHRFESEAGEMLFLHNLGTEEVRAAWAPSRAPPTWCSRSSRTASTSSRTPTCEVSPRDLGATGGSGCGGAAVEGETSSRRSRPAPPVHLLVAVRHPGPR